MKRFKFTVLLISKFISRYFRKAISAFSNRHAKDNFKTPKVSLLRKRYLILPLLVLILALFGFKLGSFTYYQTTTTEGLVGVYTKKNLPSVVTNLISEPLVTLDSSGRPQPHLAVSWQTNNDAKVYTFKLKNDLWWNDGTKLKASDIEFNIPDIEVSYPNEETIEFKLEDSFSAFPSLLTTPVLKNQQMVGVGRYRVVGEESNHNLITRLILQPKNQGENLPNLIFRFYPDERTAKTAFKLGEVDSLIALTDIDDLKKQPLIILKEVTNFNKLVAIFYSYNDKILSDKNFRKALSAATPVVEEEEPAKTSLPSSSWAFNDQIKELVGQKELAKSYLKKVQSGADSTITLTTTPSLSAVGERIIQSWKEAGISAVLRIESGSPQNFQALLTSQSIPSDPDQYALWHSTQVNTNLSKYNSQRADKDLEDGRKSADLEKRKENYLDFQKTLIEDSPATFLYFPKTNIIYRKTASKNIEKILSLQLASF